MKAVKIESKLNLNEKEESEQNDKERKDTERPTDLILNFNEVYERNIGEKVWSLLVRNYYIINMIVEAGMEMIFGGDEICGDSRFFVFLGSKSKFLLS